MTRQELLALCRKRGAIGFDYSQTASGAIDWWKPVYASEGVTPMVTLEEPVHQLVEEPIYQPVYDLIPGPDEVSPPLDTSPFANIPDALRSVPRWSVWQKQADGRKIPYTVLQGGFWSRSERCKSNQPSDWVTYSAALACYLKANGHLGGLSFALGDGWCGFDFDDVIVDGETHPQAASWLSRLGGYQEVSQNGKGIKTILRGSLKEAFLGTAETGRQFKNIPTAGMATEVYHCRRFFFLTGKGSGEPTENQSVIDAITAELVACKAALQPKPKRRGPNSPASRGNLTLSDVAVLEKIRTSLQAVKFESLWAGNTGAYQSPSEADMALTAILMFWCGNDVTQVERLFSQSGLAQREKWDREDYRVRTLAKAEQSEVYTPRVPKGYAEALKRAKGVQNG